MKATRAEKNFGVIQFHCTENIAYFWFPKYHMSAQAAKGTHRTVLSFPNMYETQKKT
jgi:hypothetical protein